MVFFLLRHYVCSVCKGNVDVGELVNGVCHECRMEAERKQQSVKVIRDEFEEERNRRATSDEM